MNETKAPRLEILTPMGLLGTFAGLLSGVARDTLTIRGIYKPEGTREYTSSELGAHWFDQLADEASSQTISMMVPSRLRVKLEPERVVVLRGYVYPKLAKAGTVDLRFVVTEVLEQKKRELDPLELARFEILRNRINIPHQDLNGLLRQTFFEGRKPKILAILGESAVVADDVRQALRDVEQLIDFQERRVSFGSPTSIVQAIENAILETPVIIALIAGGGEHLKLFDDPKVADEILLSSIPIVAALGHANDVPLAAQVAERSFPTPTAFGDWLFHTFDDLRQNQSKALKEFEKVRELQTKVNAFETRARGFRWESLWGFLAGVVVSGLIQVVLHRIL